MDRIGIVKMEHGMMDVSERDKLHVVRISKIMRGTRTRL